MLMQTLPKQGGQGAPPTRSRRTMQEEIVRDPRGADGDYQGGRDAVPGAQMERLVLSSTTWYGKWPVETRLPRGKRVARLAGTDVLPIGRCIGMKQRVTTEWRHRPECKYLREGVAAGSLLLHGGAPLIEGPQRSS